MPIFGRFKKKKYAELDAERRQVLIDHGRITDGRIIDTDVGPRGEEVVFYVYTLNGVDFESSEFLSEEQRRDPLKYAPGAKVGVRYDPRNQGNSMLE
jgi:hypothetical protein